MLSKLAKLAPDGSKPEVIIDHNFNLIPFFQCPPGVLREDWYQLADKNESPSAIGSAVARIISALQQDVAAQMTRLKTFVDRRASDCKT